MTFTFSIIIPTYNRPERLATCLEGLTQLDYPRDRVQVIVVNDGSKMALEPIVEPFQNALNLTLINQPNSGPAQARNTGAAEAQGQFLVFTDDDCIPSPDWLKALEAGFETAPNAMMGGETINALPDNLYSTTSQMLIDYLYDYYNQGSQQAYFFASNNLALPRASFQKIGSFDTSFPLAAGEDRELCDRWRVQGYSMLSVCEAQVYHAHYLSFRKFWRQHFNYGRGAFHFQKIHAQRDRDQIKVEPWSFYYRLLTYPFSKPSSHPALLIAMLFFLSQVANVAGFFWERFRFQETQFGEDRLPKPMS